MKIKLFIVLLFLSAGFATAQFGNNEIPDPPIKDAITNGNSNNNLLFGFFNSENFKMTHNFSMSYVNLGSNSMALGVYTNSMFYRISDPLTVQLDVSLTNSPYNSFGKQFQNDFNQIFISKAQINWKPAENFNIMIQYRNIPNSMGYYNPYGFNNSSRYFYNEDGFNDWYIGK